MLKIAFNFHTSKRAKLYNKINVPPDNISVTENIYCTHTVFAHSFKNNNTRKIIYKRVYAYYTIALYEINRSLLHSSYLHSVKCKYGYIAPIICFVRYNSEECWKFYCTQPPCTVSFRRKCSREKGIFGKKIQYNLIGILLKIYPTMCITYPG